MTEQKGKFSDLYKMLHAIDVAPYCKEKQKLKYLPWANAYNLISQSVDDFNYEVITYEVEGYKNPFYFDMDLGYMVHTKITINGHTREERLPVINETNKSVKSKDYNYSVKEWKDRKWTGKFIDKKVEQASSMDINTAIKRCFVKNCALFGLGIDLYIGEDVETILFDEELALATISLLQNEIEWTAYKNQNAESLGKSASCMRAMVEKKQELREQSK